MDKFPIKFKKYRDWSIKFKLLVISVSLILCSVFFVSLLSYIRYTRDFQEHSANNVKQIIDQVSLNIDTYLDDLFTLSLSPYFNKDVMDALEEGIGRSPLQQLNNTRIVEDFLKGVMIISRKDIINVFIIADDNIYYSGTNTKDIDTSVNFLDFYWYKKALETKDTIFVPVHTEQMFKNPRFKVFSVVKQIRSTKNTNRIVGVIKVDANYTIIQAICNKVNMGQEGVMFIIDENENLIYTSPFNNGHFNNDAYHQLYETIQDKKGPFFTAKVGNKPFLINSTKMPRSNWTIVAVNSISEMNKKASNTRNIAFLMAVICSTFAILILFVFIKRFLNPLFAIVKLMKEIQKGNLYVKFNETGSDEIGYLGSSFNAMVLKINEMFEQNTKLIKEVYEAKFLQKEAQINALNSQIRPHFIYNTLNMISLMVQSCKYEKAVDNINKLSTILRKLAGSDKETTLQSEIDLLNSYLSIQCNRYEGRLAYSIDIDKYLLNNIIPPIIFQPIVENAVIHGCESKKDKTFIRIYNTEEDDNIVFNITDNGKGMNNETLARLREKVDSPENNGHEFIENTDGKSGIGLVNVNRRIKIKYGQKYGLKIDSFPGKGTHVKIVLPNNLSEEKK